MAKSKRKTRRATPPVIAAKNVAAKAAEDVSEALPSNAAAGTDSESPEAPKAGRKVGQFQDVSAVIKPEMIAYLFWKEWWKARDRGDFEFVFELSAPGSQLRTHFGDEGEFPEVCRRKMRPILGARRGDLRKIRLHSDSEAYLIHAIDTKARERRDYDAERWFMLRGDAGWRVHQIDKITVPKTRDPGDLTLEDFPDVVFPAT